METCDSSQASPQTNVTTAESLSFKMDPAAVQIASVYLRWERPTCLLSSNRIHNGNSPQFHHHLLLYMSFLKLPKGTQERHYSLTNISCHHSSNSGHYLVSTSTACAQRRHENLRSFISPNSPCLLRTAPYLGICPWQSKVLSLFALGGDVELPAILL